jgi:3-deoxy-D-manno-octulosonic-acid transferase/heptosyltransferase-1
MRRVEAEKGPKTPRSILVVRLGAIGDVIRTLPAVSCMRRTWPEARISWAVEEPSRDLLVGHPDVDEVLLLRRKLLADALTLRNPVEAWVHLRDYLRGLRRRRFDWVVDLHGTLKSALLTRFSGGTRLFGLGPGHARERAHLLYTDPLPLPRRRMSRVERALGVARMLGADTSAPRRILPPRDEAAAFARGFLEGDGLRPPRVLVYPGTSEAQAYKRYPAPLFARLADRIAGETGGSILIAWGPGEEEIARSVREAMRQPATLAPRTRLDQLAEIARGCDLFVGSDTGPLHLAAAVGVPLLALYGPTDALVNAPYTESPHVAMAGDVKCRPCRNRGCRNRSCLWAIEPEEAARRAMELLEAGDRPSGGGLP